MVRRLAYLACAILIVGLAAKPNAQESRSIALILDASGSMNARLSAGDTRIDAAKEAVRRSSPSSIRASGFVLSRLRPPVADRAHDCKDTELMVDFAPASTNRDAIIAKTQTVKAQGYTPITYVIELAAADVAKETGARTIVLVSDGKETCDGDPCAAAKALAEADASPRHPHHRLQCRRRRALPAPVRRTRRARHLFGCDRRRRSRRPPGRGRRREGPAPLAEGQKEPEDDDRDHHHQAEARPAAD